MDALTASYYSANATACAARYDTASVASLHELLRSLATPRCRVLEIGGGSGRDAAFLVQLGCDTTYTDGCEEMVAQAVRLHPELEWKARLASFPLADDDPLLKERYDMVLCAAVIMHLDDGCLERFLPVAPLTLTSR
jgi:2-polyprenyl-3-methyl-5-hydroxy-6-metoxy-1,4-benzoquinol methylase